MKRNRRSKLLWTITMCIAILAFVAAMGTSANAQKSAQFEPDDGALAISSGDLVKLQTLLTQLGYYSGPATGIVDSMTVSGVGAIAEAIRRQFVRDVTGRELVLNCRIEEGVPRPQDIQILVDEEREIVIYNFHLPAVNDYNPIRRFPSGGYFDLSMEITLAYVDGIMANDNNGVFAISKKSGRFAYSFVTLVPTNTGQVLPFGNTHLGQCVRSAFD